VKNKNQVSDEAKKDGKMPPVYTRGKRKRKIANRLRGVHEETGQEISVAVLKPEPDEDEKDPRPAMLDAATKCWERISTNEHPHGKEGCEAVRLLNESGWSWVPVLALVEQYCNYPASHLEEVHDEFKEYLRKMNKKIRRFESKITKWEAEIRAINTEIEDYLHVDVAAHAPQFTAFKGALQIAKVNSLYRTRKKEIEKESIVYLCHLIKLSTGRAHYKELANILYARAGQSFDEHTLEITMARFKEDNPSRYRDLQQGARSLLRDQPFSDQKFPPPQL
jgi:hypothetical protein